MVAMLLDVANGYSGMIAGHIENFDRDMNNNINNKKQSL